MEKVENKQQGLRLPLEIEVKQEEDGRYKCPECDKLYTEKQSLKRHRINKHCPHAARFKCPIKGCKIGIAYLRRENVRTHISHVHKLDPYKYFPKLPKRVPNSTPLVPVRRAERVAPKNNSTDNLGAPPVVDLSSGSEKEGDADPASIIPQKIWKMERHPCVVTGCCFHFSSKSILRKHVRRVHGLDPMKLQLYTHKNPCTDRSMSTLDRQLPKKATKDSDSDDDEDHSSMFSSEDSDAMNDNDGDKVEEATVCILCCSSFFPGASGDSLSKEEDKKFFSSREVKDFLKNLIEKQAEFRTSDLRRVGRLQQLCPNCYLVMKAAVKKSKARDDTEDAAIRIQSRAQRRTKKLQRKMIDYCGEIRKLEETINGGDGSCLKARLEENPDREDYNQLVMLLREGIVSAENNLQAYYGHVQSTICDDKVRKDTSDESEESSIEEGQNSQESRKNGAAVEIAKMDFAGDAGSDSHSGSENYRPDSEQDDSDNYWSSSDSENEYSRRRRSGRNRKGSRKMVDEDSDDSGIKRRRNNRKKRKITYKEVNSDDSSSEADDNSD